MALWILPGYPIMIHSIPFIATLFFSATLSAASCSGSSGSSAAASKRGIAFPGGNKFPNDIFQVQNNSAITWQYGWDVYPPTPSVDSITHVPMLWGTDGAPNFVSAVKSLGAKTILAFNEPDLSGQSALSPNAAADLWKAKIQPLKELGVRLGSPAISSAPDGIPWLQEFLRLCQGCTVDFLALHWYGEGAQNFQNYLDHFHQTFPDHQLWVTEYASTSTDTSEVLSFLAQTMKYMDSVSWVEKYAWFIYGRDSTGLNSHLLDASGNLNSLGREYTS